MLQVYGGGTAADRSSSLKVPQSSMPAVAERSVLLDLTIVKNSTPDSPVIVVCGNRTLASLNLARNNITQTGIAALVDAVIMQVHVVFCIVTVIPKLDWIFFVPTKSECRMTKDYLKNNLSIKLNLKKMFLWKIQFIDF